MAPEIDHRQRLWVVTELYFPEETSTGYYMTRIAEGLAEEFDVKVISGQPNYSARGVRAPRIETRNNVEIFRVAGTTLDKNVIPLRIINMATFGFSVMVAALRRFKSGDRVLVVTNPPSTPFIIALASLFRGAAYYPLIHDNYPEMLIATGDLREDSFSVGLLGRLNRWLFKHATKIIVVGRDMHELVRRKSEGLDVPIIVIPNWAELETVSPAPRTGNQLLAELGLEDKFVLLYAGNLGRPNDVESIIDAAEMLSSDEVFHFIFLGDGAKRAWLEREVRQRRLENVSLVAPRPRSEQTVFLNACDVALVSLVNKMLGVSMPSRTYNILAAGKPIIGLTEKGSELEHILQEENVGWNVPPHDPGALAAVIREAYSRRDELSEMAKRARAAAEGKYALGSAMERYREALK